MPKRSRFQTRPDITEAQPRSRASLAVLATAAAFFAAGCAGELGTARIAATPAIDLPNSVAVGEPLDIGYSWELADDFAAPGDDYQVFVHMRAPDGTILFQDDHYPSEPTTVWSAGTTQSYRRWYYPPEDLEVEYIDFVVGLYNEAGRAEVMHDGAWQNEANVRRVQIRVEDLSGIPVWMNGWHPLEQISEPEEQQWRWSAGEAHALFANPRTDAILHLHAHGPFDEIGAQRVVFLIGEVEVASIDISDAAAFVERLEISAAALGEEDWTELVMRVEPSMLPRELDPESTDDRELGLQVYSLFLSSS